MSQPPTVRRRNFLFRSLEGVIRHFAKHLQGYVIFGHVLPLTLAALALTSKDISFGAVFGLIGLGIVSFPISVFSIIGCFLKKWWACLLTSVFLIFFAALFILVIGLQVYEYSFGGNSIGISSLQFFEDLLFLSLIPVVALLFAAAFEVWRRRLTKILIGKMSRIDLQPL